MLPWLTFHKFQKEQFIWKNIKHDLSAGLLVGLILIPQSLAYAQLAGLPPVYGLYASILPVAIAVLFGSSNYLSTGPVAVVSLLTAATIAPLAPAGSSVYITYAILLALFSGIIQISLGLLKAGWLVSLLSHPVVYGFTNAAAIVIGFTQLGNLFGVSAPVGDYFLQTVWYTLAEVVSNPNFYTLSLALGGLLILYTCKKIYPKFPASLFVLIGGSILVWYFDLPVKTVGVIENAFPNFGIPDFKVGAISDFVMGGLTIALIGFTETIAIAETIAAKAKEKIDPNRELIGQGAANITSALSGGYPVAGSITRTALNYASGAKTWMASAFSAVVVVCGIFVAAPLLQFIPNVLLAVIIITAVLSIFDFSQLPRLFQVSLHDGMAAVFTFVATLLFAPNLEIGLLVGVLFSMAHFIYRNTHPPIIQLSRHNSGALYDAEAWNLQHCETIAVIRVDGPLFFGNARYVQNRLIQFLHQHSKIQYVVLVANSMSQIDATGVEALEEVLDYVEHARVHLVMANVKYFAETMLQRINVYDRIGAENFFPNTQLAVQSALTLADAANVHTDAAHCPLVTEYTAAELNHSFFNPAILRQRAQDYVVKALQSRKKEKVRSS